MESTLRFAVDCTMDEAPLATDSHAPESDPHIDAAAAANPPGDLRVLTTDEAEALAEDGWDARWD